MSQCHLACLRDCLLVPPFIDLFVHFFCLSVDLFVWFVRLFVCFYKGLIDGINHMSLLFFTGLIGWFSTKVW